MMCLIHRSGPAFKSPTMNGVYEFESGSKDGSCFSDSLRRNGEMSPRVVVVAMADRTFCVAPKVFRQDFSSQISWKPGNRLEVHIELIEVIVRAALGLYLLLEPLGKLLHTYFYT